MKTSRRLMNKYKRYLVSYQYLNADGEWGFGNMVLDIGGYIYKESMVRQFEEYIEEEEGLGSAILISVQPLNT